MPAFMKHTCIMGGVHLAISAPEHIMLTVVHMITPPLHGWHRLDPVCMRHTQGEAGAPAEGSVTSAVANLDQYLVNARNAQPSKTNLSYSQGYT